MHAARELHHCTSNVFPYSAAKRWSNCFVFIASFPFWLMDSTQLFVHDLSIVYALTWWASLLLLNIVGWGLVRSVTSRWHDAGWALSRPLFMLAAAYFLWVVAHGIPVFISSGIWLLVALGAVMAIALARSRNR